jgi:hypothetical protein
MSKYPGRPLRYGYLLAPRDLRHSLYYGDAWLRALRRWPHVTWAESVYSDKPDLQYWADLLRRLSVLALIPRPDGTLDEQCWHEVSAALKRPVSVYALLNGGWHDDILIEAAPEQQALVRMRQQP